MKIVIPAALKCHGSPNRVQVMRAIASRPIFAFLSRSASRVGDVHRSAPSETSLVWRRHDVDDDVNRFDPYLDCPAHTETGELSIVRQ